VGCRMNGFWETGCELSLYPKHYSSEGECFLAEIGSSGTVNGMREGFFQRNMSWSSHLEFTFKLTADSLPFFPTNLVL
jgi:hypothetical protein